jgi:hypothetical protein
MKTRTIYPLVAFAFLLVFAISSCEDKITNREVFKANVPVYKSFEEIRSSVKIQTSEPLRKPGKIYMYGNYMFINELEKGIHVIDNSDAKAPENLVFISIPGNVDIAVRGNYLYADSYMDLLVFDISDISNIKQVKRIENAFPQFYPEFDQNCPIVDVDNTKGVIVAFETKEVTKEIEQSNMWDWRNRGDFVAMAEFSNSSKASSQMASVSGKGGSMARFIPYKSFLYILNNSQLIPFDISNPVEPVAKQSSWVWQGETVFINNDRLFIGTRTGMQIYDLTNPVQPVYISGLSHFYSCDPVVVEGDYAYSTLRGGTLCRTTLQSQLEVINIKDIKNPKLISTFSMVEPYGLGIEDKILFVCDGGAGLKVYDATDPATLGNKMIKSYSNIHAFDVIPFNKKLLMIGNDGFYQYDFSDVQDIKLLSKIPVIN